MSIKLTTLASFTSYNGAYPLAGVIEDAAGNLFGTTAGGGSGQGGTVFEIAAGSGSITTLASFTGDNGALPLAGVIEDATGNLFGTTSSGGDYGGGTVFKVAAGSGSVTTLASFSNGLQFRADVGMIQAGGVIQDAHGNLFGTTEFGGTGGIGTVFEIAADAGSMTTLVNFNGANGEFPVAGLIKDADGNLFGTTSGGLFSFGTVFEIDAVSHSLTTLGSFNGTNGFGPLGGVIEDTAGNLFGTTSDGGANDDGTVFEIVRGSNTVTTLVSFNGANGFVPSGGVIEDIAGNLFGTTSYGGANGVGIVFEIVKGSNTVTTLVSFNGIDGGGQSGGVIEDTAGNLFGTTGYGDANDYGTVFEVATNAGAEATATPAAPTITQENPAGLAQTGLLTVTGTAEVGSTVQAYDGTTAIGDSTTANTTTGAYSLTLTTALTDGAYSIDVTALNGGGVTSAPSPTTAVTVDTIAPTLSVTETIAGLTKQTSDVISGTVYDLNGVKGVEVYDGATDLGAATVTGGTWSFSAAGLTLGTHGFTAIATDNADNSAHSISAGADVRIVAPAASIVNLNGWNNVVTGQTTSLAPAGTTGPVITGAAYGNTTILGTAADETINANGWNNTIIGGGGNDTINAGLGNATVNVSDVDGDNTVNGAQGYTTVSLGNGNNTINLSGFNDVITLGRGHNVITGPQGRSTINLAGGTANVTTSGWNAAFTLGDGAFAVGGMQGGASFTLTSGFSASDSLDLVGTAGYTFTAVGGVLTVLNPNNALYATIDATATHQSLTYAPDANGGMVVTLGANPTNPGTGGGPANTITETQGNINLQIGNGDRAVVLTGWNNVLAGGTGAHVVSGAQGNANVTLQGNNTVAMAGWSNVITLGNGLNSVQAGDGNETITVGNGTNTLQAGGYNNKFTVTGSGHSTITAGDGNATVSLSGGTDVVHLKGWSNLVIGGFGSTQVDGGQGNTYQVGGAGTGTGFNIADFGTSNSDILDLSQVLKNWDHHSSVAGFLKVVASGRDTIVSVDISGRSNFHQVALLQGAGAASLSDLQSHNAVNLGNSFNAMLPTYNDK